MHQVGLIFGYRLPPDYGIHCFVRYGHGNRLLSARYRVDLAPHPFAPCYPSLTNWLLASTQFLALWWGYHTAQPALGWSIPSHKSAW